MFETVTIGATVIFYAWLSACVSIAVGQRRDLYWDAVDATMDRSFLEMQAYSRVSFFKHVMYLATLRNPMRLYRVA